MNNLDNKENEVIYNDIPSFEEINRRIDYSPLKSQLQEKKARQLMLKRITVGFASVVLVVGALAVGYKILKIENHEIPFELGTYLYESNDGELEELYFNENSRLVLSDEKIAGSSAFEIVNNEDNWIVYGKFYDCGLEDYNFDLKEIRNDSYILETNNYLVDISIFENTNQVVVRVSDYSEHIKIYFNLSKE